MFNKAIILGFINIFLVFPVLAQSSLESQLTNAKFQVIKASVEFFASDKLTFPKVKEATCPSCKSYGDLKEFAQNNKLEGVPDFITHWRSVKLDTTPQNAKASLKAFVQRISDTLVTGSKAKRKSLASYAKFESSLKSIKAGIRLPTAKANAAADTGDGSEPRVKAPLKDSATTVSQISQDGQEETDKGSWLPLKYVVFGETALIIILFFIIILKTKDYKRNRRKREKEYDRNRENDFVQLENALFRVKSLESELSEAQRETELLQQDILYQKSIAKSPAPEAEKAAVIVKRESPVIQKEIVPEIAPEIKYARYADLGDGFTNADLLTQEDDETIFEITILTPSTAQYRVTRNVAAQKYALANANYFLSKTCKYDTSPTGTILTDTPGELRLLGSKWKIEELVKISFT